MMAPRTKYDDLWDRGYVYAEAWARVHGSLADCALKAVSPGGFKIGNWVSANRAAWRGSPNRRPLTGEQIRLLDDLGMVWEPKPRRGTHLDADGGAMSSGPQARGAAWQIGLDHARAYADQHGDLSTLTHSYVAPDGYKLGPWMTVQRRQWRMAELGHTAHWTPERFAALDELGMVWAPGRGRPKMGPSPAGRPIVMSMHAVARWLRTDLRTAERLMTRLRQQVADSAPRRLADSMIADVESGNIGPGEQMPTVADLRALGHRSETVMAARRMVQEEGIAVSTPLGMYVRDTQ